MIKGCKEKFFINQIFDENIRRLHQGKKLFGKRKHFFAEKLFSLMKTSDIFVENLVNKKLLLAAFYHLTYQHDSMDFNICNYKRVLCAWRSAIDSPSSSSNEERYVTPTSQGKRPLSYSLSVPPLLLLLLLLFASLALSCRHPMVITTILSVITKSCYFDGAHPTT